MWKYRAELKRWHRGSLRTTVHEFDSFEDAHDFAEADGTGTVKVYSPENELLHVSSITPTQGTYA
jgi:hypothetical protein